MARTGVHIFFLPLGYFVLTSPSRWIRVTFVRQSDGQCGTPPFIIQIAPPPPPPHFGSEPQRGTTLDETRQRNHHRCEIQPNWQPKPGLMRGPFSRRERDCGWIRGNWTGCNTEEWNGDWEEFDPRCNREIQKVRAHRNHFPITLILPFLPVWPCPDGSNGFWPVSVSTPSWLVLARIFSHWQKRPSGVAWSEGEQPHATNDTLSLHTNIG